MSKLLPCAAPILRAGPNLRGRSYSRDEVRGEQEARNHLPFVPEASGRLHILIGRTMPTPRMGRPRKGDQPGSSESQFALARMQMQNAD